MKIALALSGGMDSVTALAVALDAGHEVLAVCFDYGSKHNRYEATAFRNIINHYNIPSRRVDLTEVGIHLKSKLMSGGGDVPEGHYEEESMRDTVVPGRNLIFASVLTGIAWSHGCDQVWMGVHAGDHFIYPDCRPEFIDAMTHAIAFGTDFKVRLEAPFLVINKADILKRGLLLKVPYQLTRTCYKEQKVACGKCGSCQERLWAFDQLKTADPLDYESRELMPKKKK